MFIKTLQLSETSLFYAIETHLDGSSKLKINENRKFGDIEFRMT